MCAAAGQPRACAGLGGALRLAACEACCSRGALTHIIWPKAVGAGGAVAPPAWWVCGVVAVGCGGRARPPQSVASLVPVTLCVSRRRASPLWALLVGVCLVLYRWSRCCCCKMMDSEATFAERLQSIGLAGISQKFTDAGWSTFATFAFATSAVPGASDPHTAKAFDDEVMVPLFGSATHIDKAKVRRLHFEAYTFAAADMTMRMSRTDDDPPRRMTNAERETRWSLLVGRLAPGMTLIGIYEPSHAIINTCAEIYDSNVLRYVEWAECTQRSQELNGIKSEPMWKVDPVSKCLKAIDVPVPGKADWKGDNLLLKATLQRRGLALDMAGLMSFEVHETLVDMIFTKLVEEPPHGYAHPTINQLHDADREIWTQLCNLTRKGVKPDLAGVRPMEANFQKLLDSPRVAMIVMGHKLGGGAGSSGGGGLPRLIQDRGALGRSREDDGDNKAKKQLKAKNQELEKLRQENARLRKGGGAPPPPKPTFERTVKDKFKKKGDRADTGRGPTMPQGLIGKAARSPEGVPICFGYNLGTCTGCAPGARCSKGAHVCCEPGCGKNHPLAEHE